MMNPVLVFTIFSFISFSTQAQTLQTLRGQVIDEASTRPVAFATIEIKSFSSSSLVADSLGSFSILVPVGKYEIEVTATGYEAAIAGDIIVSSGKESLIVVRLKAAIQNLPGIEVSATVDKRKPINRMSTVSTVKIVTEQARHYAGAFDDPARLATSFPGTASNTNDNGMIVRGNAPTFLQWKMEGVEIPNPNHFANLRSIGGGTLTALSTQMLDNSDFFTGAFPAEYSNALSGVFDLNMRTGNSHRREYTFQAGIIGIDAAAEGPFKMGRGASYIFNYRYSTLALLAGLLPENANSLKYQDLSFKLNFPLEKGGTISFWGIGLLDKAGAKAKIDSTAWEFITDKQEDRIQLSSGAAGMSHKYFIGKDRYIKTTLAATVNNTDWQKQELDSDLALKPKSRINNNNINLVLSSFLNTKLSAGHSNKTGVIITQIDYRLLLNQFNENQSLIPYVNSRGSSTLISAYSSSSFRIKKKLVLNFGVSGLYFTLNKHAALEPRIGINRQISQRQSLAVAYGLHSRLETLNFYLNKDLNSAISEVNRNLDFTKAHHLVLSYNWRINEIYHFKAEGYFQYLFSVPVISDSSFSLLNLQDDWFFAEKLVNSGKGRNYGLEFSIEKFPSHGFSFLLTGSIFRSEYKGGDAIWRRTRYDRGYVFNALSGKEWKTGTKKQNIFFFNIRFNFQGGNRYSPVNETESNQKREIIFNETAAYSLQSKALCNLHLSTGIRINKPGKTQEIALKILNLTSQADFYGFKYNLKTGQPVKDLAAVMIPNLSYKIDF